MQNLEIASTLDEGAERMQERSLLTDASADHVGRYGGFSFGGEHPRGVTAVAPMQRGVRFPNGARAAVLLTFDVEGNYGNGVGDERAEIENYKEICRSLIANGVPATFNVVGQMVQDYGGEFIRWMLEAGEVAPHGYVHDMNKRYGGHRIYAGQYGPRENLEQVRDGVAAIEELFPGTVSGIRLPYGHFNEHTYDAIAALGLRWSSNVGIDDWLRPGQGFGNAPFLVKIGSKLYPIVEIPLDSQTFDWAIWMADERANRPFVDAVAAFCRHNEIEFERTPAGARRIWETRIQLTIRDQTVFTLICHPINLTIRMPGWGDPLEEFLLPIIDYLGRLQRETKIWCCTCREMADFYKQARRTLVGNRKTS